MVSSFPRINLARAISTVIAEVQEWNVWLAYHKRYESFVIMGPVVGSTASCCSSLPLGASLPCQTGSQLLSADSARSEVSAVRV